MGAGQNETPLLKDACFTKRSPHKINQPDEANASLNYALDCPKCFDDGHEPQYRYTGAAIVSNSAWFLGAGFAPLVALFLASQFGLWSVGLYLLSGVACTLGALFISRQLAQQIR